MCNFTNYNYFTLKYWHSVLPRMVQPLQKCTSLHTCTKVRIFILVVFFLLWCRIWLKIQFYVITITWEKFESLINFKFFRSCIGLGTEKAAEHYIQNLINDIQSIANELTVKITICCGECLLVGCAEARASQASSSYTWTAIKLWE